MLELSTKQNSGDDRAEAPRVSPSTGSTGKFGSMLKLDNYRVDRDASRAADGKASGWMSQAEQHTSASSLQSCSAASRKRCAGNPVESKWTGRNAMNLLDIRKSKGLTQQQAAEAAGMSQQRLSEYERGVRSVNHMSLEQAARLADALKLRDLRKLLDD